MAYSHKDSIKRSKRKLKYRIEVFKKNGNNTGANKVKARLEKMDKDGI